MLIVAAIFFAVCVSIVGVHEARSASIWDAITGHVSDIKDRILVDEEEIMGIKFAKGTFRDTDPGRDALHWANGTVSVVKTPDGYYLQLEKDFEASLAPDLYVYTALKSKFIVDEETFHAAQTVEIGKLKRGKGATYYKLPKGVDLNQVVIWCKNFGEFMGSAHIK